MSHRWQHDESFICLATPPSDANITTHTWQTRWCQHHDSCRTHALPTQCLIHPSFVHIVLLAASCIHFNMTHSALLIHVIWLFHVHRFDMTLSCPSLWYDSFMSIALWPAMFVTLSAAHSCTAASRVTLSVFYTCMNESCPIDKWVMSLTHMHIRARLRLVPLSLSSIIDPPKETGPQVLCTISTFCTRVYNDIWRMCIFVYTDPLSGYFSRTWFSCSDMVVKTLLYCTRKCGCKGGCMSASCFLQPPRNGSTGQVPVLEHSTFSRTVLGTPRACRCSWITFSKNSQREDLYTQRCTFSIYRYIL